MLTRAIVSDDAAWAGSQMFTNLKTKGQYTSDTMARSLCQAAHVSSDHVVKLITHMLYVIEEEHMYAELHRLIEVMAQAERACYEDLIESVFA